MKNKLFLGRFCAIMPERALPMGAVSSCRRVKPGCAQAPAAGKKPPPGGLSVPLRGRACVPALGNTSRWRPPPAPKEAGAVST